MSNLLKKEKGFTLIEIVLVLAIAGLLLVIVFLAVSGAQKSRRDSQRKNDNARLMSQIESYAGNNNGDYSALTAAMFTYNKATPASSGAYAPTNFVDPLADAAYTVALGAGAPPAAATCTAPTNAVPAVATIYRVGREVTVDMCLEQGYQRLTNK